MSSVVHHQKSVRSIFVFYKFGQCPVQLDLNQFIRSILQKDFVHFVTVLVLKHVLQLFNLEYVSIVFHVRYSLNLPQERPSSRRMQEPKL